MVDKHLSLYDTMSILMKNDQEELYIWDSDQ